MKTYLVSWLFLLLTPMIQSGEAKSIWSDTVEDDIQVLGSRRIIPANYRTLSMDKVGLQIILAGAPPEENGGGVELRLPKPDGTFDLFLVVSSPVMAPELAARYPEIRTYLGKGVTDPTAVLRFDVTPAGFHAMVRSIHGTYFIDPYQANDTRTYNSYYKRDYPRPEGAPWFCETDEGQSPEVNRDVFRVPIEGELLTYRCAISCTGEYAIFHGGTVASALAAIVTSLNRVNSVYEADVAIRMILVANNDQIVFLDPNTDPFSNNNGDAMLSQNQATIDQIIGNANYDIGHVFSTNGGGVASLRVPCREGAKARGVTGQANPIGDPFSIDYVAHEMGHQWGGNHTFAWCNGSSGPLPVEPGSGATIMAYAGICGMTSDLQPNSDALFHVVNYDEIVAYSRNSFGNDCAEVVPVANSAPVVDAGDDYTIPQQTPFTLTGSATDADVGDVLSYSWEQTDRGSIAAPGIDTGTNALFRGFLPVADASRTFPLLADILNETSTIGILLPYTNRNLSFTLMTRDNHPGGGGVDYDSTQLTVTANAGPFDATTPATSTTWISGSLRRLNWDVANTDMPPVNCSAVDILLSTDGGNTFPIMLLEGTPNDGSQRVSVPNLDTANARIKIMASGNIFFDISPQNFNITNQILCVTDVGFWRQLSAPPLIDENGNGIIDVIDLLTCLYQ